MVKKVFDNFEELLGSIILIVMAVITFANVITRYFIFYALAFTEEVTINFFVWLVMLGTAIAFKKGAHLKMTFLYDKMPLKGRKMCFYVGTALSLTFFALLAYLGYIQVRDEIDLAVTSPSLAIPVYYYTFALPVFSVLIFIRIVQATLEVLRKNEF
jgi:TRAP-type C4-dicarboxylate transport system permease small subunit